LKDSIKQQAGDSQLIYAGADHNKQNQNVDVQLAPKEQDRPHQIIDQANRNRGDNSKKVIQINHRN